MEVDRLDLSKVEPGTKQNFKLNMVKNALGDYWQIPVMVARGKVDGLILGVTAAMHGNELNGVSIIHQLWKKINPKKLKGTLMCVPVMNAPGFLNNQREFHTGQDLNRIMPGHPFGTTAEVYAYKLVENILTPLNYLIDLHTASFGRVNSLYVRADMSQPLVARMAKLQDPQIIVNKPGERGNLRNEAEKLGIHAITVEVGDPHLFQRQHIRPSIFGLYNVLCDFGMINEAKEDTGRDAIICESSYWIYAKNGGILRVLPGLTEQIKEGQPIATISNIFGEVIEEIRGPEEAIVVAKATNPVCQVGSRVVHLGLVR